MGAVSLGFKVHEEDCCAKNAIGNAITLFLSYRNLQNQNSEDFKIPKI